MDSLEIKGFRNLKKVSIRPLLDHNIVALIGNNGQGKTNVLESIFLCSVSKSFKAKRIDEMIGFDDVFSSIKLEVGQDLIEVVLVRDGSQKALKINGLKHNARDFIGRLKVVYFSPDDLASMAQSPQLRRRYLNLAISQIDSNYVSDLTRYNNARKQRNALLKQIRDGASRQDQLVFWNQILAENGLRITKARREYIEGLQRITESHYQGISKSKQSLQLIYKTQVKQEYTEKEYVNELSKNAHADVMFGKTHFGPHRDDLLFKLDEHDMARFASRGEWRSLVLALKLAELKFIQQHANSTPVLLLDDVFSELDEFRQQYLLAEIRGFQTFISTTHSAFLGDLNDEILLLNVDNGCVKTLNSRSS